MNGVGTSFVQRTTGGNIGGDLGLGERTEGDFGGDGKGVGGVGRADRDTGDDVMGLVGEKRKHLDRSLGMFRFSEKAIVDGNNGVGGDDKRLRRKIYGGRFLSGHAFGEGARCFTGERRFIDPRDAHIETGGDQGQQFTATR